MTYDMYRKKIAGGRGYLHAFKGYQNMFEDFHVSGNPVATLLARVRCCDNFHSQRRIAKEMRAGATYLRRARRLIVSPYTSLLLP